jgi:GR25 family glycosyltransferase involved in LPS biosynthesis
MKAYCINLKTRTDRKKKMIEQFEREGLDVEFIEAVDASEFPESFSPMQSRGDFACASSHRKLYTKMIEDGHEMAIVFEDQCKLAEGFSNVVANLEFPERWDMIYLGYTGPRFFAQENDQLDRGKPVGTWCHLLSLEGAKKLVNFDPCDFWLISDNQLSLLPICTFYIKNKIAWRDQTSKSIIGSNYIKRGCVKWLITGHWVAHGLQFYPILEFSFLILILILYIRLLT